MKHWKSCFIHYLQVVKTLSRFAKFSFCYSMFPVCDALLNGCGFFMFLALTIPLRRNYSLSLAEHNFSWHGRLGLVTIIHHEAWQKAHTQPLNLGFSSCFSIIQDGFSICCKKYALYRISYYLFTVLRKSGFFFMGIGDGEWVIPLHHDCPVHHNYVAIKIFRKQQRKQWSIVLEQVPDDKSPPLLNHQSLSTGNDKNCCRSRGITPH